LSGREIVVRITRIDHYYPSDARAGIAPMLVPSGTPFSSN